MQLYTNIIALAVLACGELMNSHAQAATQERQIALVGSNFCRLTLPTTSSPIRNRATGVRNEGSTSTFVTCVYPSGEGRVSGGSKNTAIWLYVASLDGALHDMSCTGVASDADFNLTYVSKTGVAPPTSTGAALIWEPDDFGDWGTIQDHGQFSVTCLLPPQTAITLGYVDSTTDVGT
uniref:Uncharacterized protein n=1 Tax=uncultured bacterium pTW2 TaxID=504464 RepID=B8PZV6_9BACT|nr:hypothetical protein [uncultured bacterium pTW2]